MIAKIIAPLTGAKRDRVVLETAFVAARPTNAHVVALYVNADPRLAMPYMGAPLSPDVIQSIIDATAEISRGAAKMARAALMEATAAAGVQFESAPQRASAVTCSFLEMEGFFPHCVAEAARLSDLIVFGPVSPADGPDLSDAFVETLMKTERPVLLASIAPQSLTGSVMLAWDGSAVAARALMGALPFLDEARKITLLSCHRPGARTLHFEDVQEYLSLRGHNCTVETIDPGKHGVGEALLQAAKSGRADLLVMGGYGHSQMGEVFFGGVTQHMRWHVELPILMVH